MARVVRDHQVYKAVWTPEIDEILQWGNLEDSYAVNITVCTKDNTIIGNVPYEKSCVTWYFIEHDGGESWRQSITSSSSFLILNNLPDEVLHTINSKL